MPLDYKRILSALAVLLCLLLPAAALAAKVNAEPGIEPGQVVVDEAGLLDRSERAELARYIEGLQEKHGIGIAVVTKKSLHGKDIVKYTDNLMNQRFSPGQNGNTVLLIAIDQRDFQIVTDAKMHAIITNDGGAPYLRDAFLDDLSDGRYQAAFLAYADTVDELVSYYEKEGKPFDPADRFSWVALGIAVILALVVMYGVQVYLVSMMSNVQPGYGAGAYLLDDSIRLEAPTDTFLYMTVTRAPKPKESDRDGGSDIGGGHGGIGGKF